MTTSNEPRDSFELADVLEALCVATGIEFDRELVREAALQALRAHPHGTASAELAQLTQAGRDVGLRLVRIRISPAKALGLARPDAPVAVFLRSPDVDGLAGRWAVFTRSGLLGGRLAPVGEGRLRSRLSRSELATRMGLADAHQTAEFAVAVAALPADGLTTWKADPFANRTPRDTDHGHGHGNGNGHRSGHGHGHGHGNGHDHGGPHHHASPWRRLLGLVWLERRDIVTLLLFAAVVGIFNLAVPLTTDALVNFVAFGGLLQPLIILSVVLALCLTASGLIRLAQFYVAEMLQRRLMARFASDLAWRLPRVSAAGWDGRYPPETVNRFFEIVTVQKAAAGLLLEGINLVLSALVGLTVLGVYHPFLLTFALVLLAAVFSIVFVLGIGAVRSAISESVAKYAIADWLEELVRHPHAFKTDGGYELASRRADRLISDYLHFRHSHYRRLLRQFIGTILLQAAAGTALLALGGYLVMAGELTLGQLVAAELIVGVVVAKVGKLGKYLESWYDLMAAMDKLGHLADLPTEPEGGESPPSPANPATRGVAVEMADVCFAYDNHRQPVFEHFGLQISPGERIAIVGPGGAGSSTLLDLLYGLRTTDHGHILLDDMDIRHWRRDILRRDVALVRESAIIDGSVAENVRLGRADLTLREVRASLEAVGLWEEVLDLPGGLHASLDSGGAPLSTGQARRLTLARAMARRPRLLLLDGVLDQLAGPARRNVLGQIMNRQHGWTMVVATRVPEVIAACDRRIELAEPTEGSPHLHDHAPGPAGRIPPNTSHHEEH